MSQAFPRQVTVGLFFRTFILKRITSSNTLPQVRGNAHCNTEDVRKDYEEEGQLVSNEGPSISCKHYIQMLACAFFVWGAGVITYVAVITVNSSISCLGTQA